MSAPNPVESSIDIDASPQRVWQIVSDVRNATEWSGQAIKVFAIGSPRAGQLSLNVNKQDRFVWTTTSKVVDFQPERRIANRIFENFTIWAFELEPLPSGGTRLTERRETPQGTSRLSQIVTDRFLGGLDTATARLSDGVSLSLQRIKQLAERG